MADKKSGYGVEVKLPGQSTWADAIDPKTHKPHFFERWNDACALKLELERKGCLAHVVGRDAPPDDSGKKPPPSNQGSLL